MEAIDTFIKNKKDIPHIIFYGNEHSDKYKALNKLLFHIYDNNELFKKYTMKIQCSTNKGIDTIRDKIKIFSKHQICNSDIFKSIILYDAEYLTNDAQYSLRRCIETYSENTRFFIIIENKGKLINPILSRFIHVFFKENKNEIIETLTIKGLKNYITDIESYSFKELPGLCNQLYNKGIYGNVLVNFLKTYSGEYNDKSSKLEVYYQTIMNHLKDEKLILLYILIFFRNNINIEI